MKKQYHKPEIQTRKATKEVDIIRCIQYFFDGEDVECKCNTIFKKGRKENGTTKNK